jgi:hypothetical protein
MILLQSSNRMGADPITGGRMGIHPTPVVSKGGPCDYKMNIAAFFFHP